MTNEITEDLANTLVGMQAIQDEMNSSFHSSPIAIVLLLDESNVIFFN
jgi:hypothetical protein